MTRKLQLVKPNQDSSSVISYGIRKGVKYINVAMHVDKVRIIRADDPSNKSGEPLVEVRGTIGDEELAVYTTLSNAINAMLVVEIKETLQ